MTDKFSPGGEYHIAIDKVWKFFKKHQNAKTQEDCYILASDLNQFNTPLQVRLALAVIAEIESEYHSEGKCKQFQAELLTIEQRFNADVYELVRKYSV